MNSFGQLILLHDAEIVSTHMPFLFDEGSGVLVGHLTKADPHWQQIPKQKVLITLQGEHNYVSPSRHESSGVPTWNYQAVHIEGVAQSFTDSEKLKHVLDSFDNAHESVYKKPLEPDYATSMLSRIVSVEITITLIQFKGKFSKSSSIQDQSNVQEQFPHGKYKALANAMNNS